MVSTISNVLGTIGTVCWCIQMVPQIIANYRKKNTEGFPELMCLLWCLCAPFFAVFIVSENASIPLMLQPHLFGIFCFITYLQVMYYPPVQRPKKEILLRGGAFILFQIAIEVGFIIPLRKIYKEGTTWPTIVFGILASIILAVGLIPPYFELAKRKGRVIGINFGFLLLDFSGAVFSLASLLVDKNDLDIMGCILYSICGSLELGIFISHFIWFIRFKIFGRERVADEEVIDNVSSSDLEVEITKVENDISSEKDSAEQKDGIYQQDLTAASTLVTLEK
ncbi:hypothetical protein DAMA08_051630 [Martiniozyma asiatica (nom. inval.)]|nr:hypothetical protein DAMA08_051630 [Martiniozyma asiatica]